MVGIPFCLHNKILLYKEDLNQFRHGMYNKGVAPTEAIKRLYNDIKIKY